MMTVTTMFSKSAKKNSKTSGISAQLIGSFNQEKANIP